MKDFRPERIDGQAVAARLSDAAARAIAGIAIELIAADICSQLAHDDERQFRAGAAAFGACRIALAHQVIESAGRSALFASNGAPCLPATIGSICRGCGCSELDACRDKSGIRCSWAEPDLCSACVEQADGDGSPDLPLPCDVQIPTETGGWNTLRAGTPLSVLALALETRRKKNEAIGDG